LPEDFLVQEKVTPLPFRVLHVIETLGLGGAEQALVSLVEELRQRNVLCDVCTLWPPYDLSPNLTSLNCRVFPLGLSCRWNLFEGVRKLRKVLQVTDYAIIHSHLFFSELYVGLTQPFFPNIKRVATFHNMGYANFPPNSFWLRIRKLLHILVLRNGFNGFSGVSEAVAKQHERDLGISEVKVIPNPLPKALFSDAVPPSKTVVFPEANVPQGAFVITMAGRLSWEKGHHFFLKALAILKKQGISPFAFIVGDGPLKEQLLEITRSLSLQNQVFFSGKVPREQLFAAIQASDLLVLPSLFEGFGLVVAEAMALGTPVISSSVPGLKELVSDGETGLLFPSGNAEALAHAIHVLHAQPERRKKLAQNGKVAVCRFHPKQVVSKMMNLYHQVLHK
jgi:glycosyltransferase involved in cell wall biosynthesis